MQGRVFFCYYYVPKLEGFFFFRIWGDEMTRCVDQMKNQIDIYDIEKYIYIDTYIRRYRQNKDHVDTISIADTAVYVIPGMYHTHIYVEAYN